jgi:hypothetical protein
MECAEIGISHIHDDALIGIFDACCALGVLGVLPLVCKRWERIFKTGPIRLRRARYAQRFYPGFSQGPMPFQLISTDPFLGIEGPMCNIVIGPGNTLWFHSCKRASITVYDVVLRCIVKVVETPSDAFLVGVSQQGRVCYDLCHTAVMTNPDSTVAIPSTVNLIGMVSDSTAMFQRGWGIPTSIGLLNVDTGTCVEIDIEPMEAHTPGFYRVFDEFVYKTNHKWKSHNLTTGIVTFIESPLETMSVRTTQSGCSVVMDSGRYAVPLKTNIHRKVGRHCDAIVYVVGTRVVIHRDGELWIR